MEIIGARDCIHFEIGDEFVGGLFPVDIWYRTIHLTPVDNLVYLPQFIASLEDELKELKEKSINSDGVFLDLGPTTDDCSGRVNLNEDIAEITLEIKGKMLALEIPIDKLMTLYSRVIDRLLREYIANN